MQTSFKVNHLTSIVFCFIIGFASCEKDTQSSESTNVLKAENSTHNCAALQPNVFSPFFGCPTGGRISRIDPSSGSRVTVVDNLPTSVGTNADGTKADFFGPAD